MATKTCQNMAYILNSLFYLKLEYIMQNMWLHTYLQDSVF